MKTYHVSDKGAFKPNLNILHIGTSATTWTTIEKFGVSKIFKRRLFCSPRL